MPKTFPQQLREEIDRLQAKGLNREQIAAPLGYTSRRVNDWEKGRATPSAALKSHILRTLRAVK